MTEDEKLALLNKVRADQFRTRLFNASISVSATIAIVGMFIFIFSQLGVPDAVVTYEVEAKSTAVCVGEPLIFSSVAHIHEDAVIRFSASVINLDTGRTAQQIDMSLRTTIRKAGDVIRGRQRSIELDDLAPGNYRYALGAETSGHKSGFIFIDFIVEDCE